MNSKEPLDRLGMLKREIARLRAELDEKQKEITRLTELVDRDLLLPVLNRRAFERELARFLSSAQRYDCEAALVYFDIDGLKAINDQHGHNAGDRALELVAKTLMENCRATDIVARLGGDEFALVLMQTDQVQGQKKAAELAASVAAQPLKLAGGTIFLSVSFGVSICTDIAGATTIIQEADKQMYKMKSKG